MKKLPRRFQRIFWFCKIDKFDIKRDKREIITRVLNYGTWEDVKLLMKIYSKDDIKEVISNPQRGVWFEKVLNFWSRILGIKIKKKIYEKAILKMELGKELLRKHSKNNTGFSHGTKPLL